VDAAMVDGASVLTTMFTALRSMGVWEGGRGQNVLDTGAPWYEVYACADGRFVAVGALEPQFYAELVHRTGFRVGEPEQARVRQPGPDRWAVDKALWAQLWATRTREEWIALLGHTDACVQPVLDWDERLGHPHLQARGTFVELDGIVQPAPAPRLSRTPSVVRRRPPVPGEHTREVAAELGLDVEALLASGAVTQAAEQ